MYNRLIRGLEIAEGYRARMDILESKMKPMKDEPSNTNRKGINESYVQY